MGFYSPKLRTKNLAALQHRKSACPLLVTTQHSEYFPDIDELQAVSLTFTRGYVVLYAIFSKSLRNQLNFKNNGIVFVI